MEIETRVAEREALMQSKMVGQRRLARPEEYVYDKSQEAYWDLKDGTMHSEKGVDASIPIVLWRVEVEAGEEAKDSPRGPGRPKKRKEKLIPPSRDILRVESDRLVEGSTWWPGHPQVIKDWFIDKDGFHPAEGRRIYNQYRPPPAPVKVVEGAADLWVEHVKRLWPDPVEHEYFFDYCAHMVQRPHEKCNAAIVLSGTQGIGKDAALLPVKAAVGAWNTKGIDPDELFSAYRPWLQTLMLVIDEVRPSKDEFHASSMYNILKPMIVAPPNTLPVNDKYTKLRYIINVLRVFITTNDWMAMYIPPEDRRLFIMHSTLPQQWHVAEGRPDYFRVLFGWFDNGGCDAVAAWLGARDLRHFDPNAQIAKTMGWQAVANTWGEPEDAISAALEALDNPDVVFATELQRHTFDGKEELALMLQSPRRTGNRLQKSGYVAVKSPHGERWQFNHEGGFFRARMAFVKHGMTNDKVKMYAEIEARGLGLAAEMRAPQLRAV